MAHSGLKATTVTTYPPYAILSHTWGREDQEVLFEDIQNGGQGGKVGYNKLQFCADQAAKDHLRYFWVDTCCIDKKSSAELHEAINSMFSWYRKATVCYVYLADVSVPLDTQNEQSVGDTWNQAFLQSRWFRRGWTLQELLAPASVQFFSAEGQFLGNRSSLQEAIHDATGIPYQALQGHLPNLDNLSVAEKISWTTSKRETTRDEDMAYSLLGLFDVCMPLLYGEGRHKAFIRLHEEIEKEKARKVKEDAISAELYPAKPTANAQHSAQASGQLPQKDRGSSEEDMTNEDELVKWWDEAMRYNARAPRAHVSVAVLMFRWADEIDQFVEGHRHEVADLEAVFQDCFNFSTTVVQLDVATNPDDQLRLSLVDLVEKHDGPRNLLIVYYTGHSIYTETSNSIYLTPTSESSNYDRGAYADLRVIESFLRTDDVEADVLTLLDASFTGTLMRNKGMHAHRRTHRFQNPTAKKFEIMAPGSLSPAPGPRLFTRALITSLTEIHKDLGQQSFSTFELHQQMQMDPQRTRWFSTLWQLIPSDRNIRLAAVKPRTDTTLDRAIRKPLRSKLKLSLGLRDEALDKEQIQFLSKQLTTLFEDPRLLGLRSIDWLGVEPVV